jgi:hypothetical protein
MLHKEAIDGATLGLLKSLQSKQYLKGFYLAGGTALALYNGYRRSVDIDLFSDYAFDTSQMMENLSQDFQFKLMFAAPNTLKGTIDSINVDILAHRYNMINEPLREEDIEMLSEADIAAMKLNAISTSGQRIKDFIDIYFLSEKYDLKSMLEWYFRKYSQTNDLLILKSLIYFDDVDESEWPMIIKEPGLKWKKVRQKIEKTVLSYARQIAK